MNEGEHLGSRTQLLLFLKAQDETELHQITGIQI